MNPANNRTPSALALGVCQFIARFSTHYHFFKFYVCVFGVFSLDPIKHFLPPINVNYVYRVFVFIVFGGPIIKVSRKTVFAPFY